jgi:hypothetical protein
MVVGLTALQWDVVCSRRPGISDAVRALGARLGVNLDDEGHRFPGPRCPGWPLFEPRGSPPARWPRSLDASKARVTWGPYRTVRQAIACDADLSTAHPMFSMLEQPGIGTYLAPACPLDFGAVPRVCRPRRRPRWASTPTRSCWRFWACPRPRWAHCTTPVSWPARRPELPSSTRTRALQRGNRMMNSPTTSTSPSPSALPPRCVPLPVRPERMVHFFPPHIEKIRARVPETAQASRRALRQSRGRDPRTRRTRLRRRRVY